LIKAKIAVQNGDLDTAATELQWALDAAGDKASTAIARLRLARVEAARGNLDIALQMVQGKDAGEMASQYIEAKGDFYLQQGNQAAAFTAYEAAMADIAMQNSTARALLQLKIGQVQPAPEAPAPDTEVDQAVTDQ
jgi:predicted negative regulator of RcsB-dependent stress response